MNNLENYSVLELDTKEIRETYGGFVCGGLCIAVIGGLIISLVDNFEDAINGAVDGWNAAP